MRGTIKDGNADPSGAFVASEVGTVVGAVDVVVALVAAVVISSTVFVVRLH